MRYKVRTVMLHLTVTVTVDTLCLPLMEPENESGIPQVGQQSCLRVPKVSLKKFQRQRRQAQRRTDGRGGALVIKVARKRRRFNLEQLVSNITEENRTPEIEWGTARGNGGSPYCRRPENLSG